MAKSLSLSLPVALLVAFLTITPSLAQGPPWDNNNNDGNSGWWNSDDNPFYNGGSSSGSGSGSSGSGSSSGNGNGLDLNGLTADDLAFFGRMNRVAIAHAVMACVAWVLLIPMGSILLRLNLKSPIILKLHGAIQVSSYFLYIVAAGMGIWIVKQWEEFVNVWSDPHVILGLLILALAFFQPALGIHHHNIYKKRAADVKAGVDGPKPGRTSYSRAHVWLGRGLITFAIINGGLGLRLAGNAGLQDETATRNAKIAYAVIAAFMWLLYMGTTIIWEHRKSVRERQERNTSPIVLKQRGSGYASPPESEPPRRSFETLPPAYSRE